MDRSEEEDLDDAALQLLRFLGQVYVQLQEAEAVERYVCEQYEASVRFIRRCTSGSSHSDMSASEGPTRRTPGQEVSQSHNGNGHTREQQQHITPGPEGERSQELAALCEYLNTVLAEAQAVREGSKEAFTSKAREKIRGSKSASNRQHAMTNKDVADRGSSIAITNTVNKISVTPTKDKIIRPNSRKASIGSHKTVKLRRTLVSAASGACNMIQSRKSSPESQSDETCRLPRPLSTRPKPSPAPTSSTRQEELAFKSTASKPTQGKATETSEHQNLPLQDLQTEKRCRLQFPEKYRALRCWFKAREQYWHNTYAVSRIKPAAEETFISLLDDVHHQQDLSDDECEVAASPIRELQKVMEDLASCNNGTQMLSLLRLAPPGSKIADIRNFSIQKLLPSGTRDGNLVTEMENDHMDIREVSNLSWLPQRCWVHLREVLNSVQLLDFSVKELERGPVTYSEAEQIVVIARLSHCIQVTLFHRYLEEVFAQSLFHRHSAKEEEVGITSLLRCQLAHSILCKEGRALFVLAEKITAPA